MTGKVARAVALRATLADALEADPLPMLRDRDRVTGRSAGLPTGCRGETGNGCPALPV
jgi:hypothetical protein